jgi:hypothetical protein
MLQISLHIYTSLLLKQWQYVYSNGPNYDRQWKIRYIIDILNEAYSKCYAHFEHLAVENVTALFKLWIIFKWYIPKKQMFGNRTKMSTECDMSHYTYHIDILLGKDPTHEQHMQLWNKRGERWRGMDIGCISTSLWHSTYSVIWVNKKSIVLRQLTTRVYRITCYHETIDWHLATSTAMVGRWTWHKHTDKTHQQTVTSVKGTGTV